MRKHRNTLGDKNHNVIKLKSLLTITPSPLPFPVVTDMADTINWVYIPPDAFLCIYLHMSLPTNKMQIVLSNGFIFYVLL